MALHKFSHDELAALGVPEEQINKILGVQAAPKKPRLLAWVVKCSEEEALRVVEAFPFLAFERRYSPRGVASEPIAEVKETLPKQINKSK